MHVSYWVTTTCYHRLGGGHLDGCSWCLRAELVSPSNEGTFIERVQYYINELDGRTYNGTDDIAPLLAALEINIANNDIVDESEFVE